MGARIFVAMAAFCLIAGSIFAGDITVASKEVRIEPPRAKRFEVSAETSQMFNVDGNKNHYYMMTQMVSLGWEPFKPLKWGWFRMRTQFMGTFYASAILRGAETYYFGGGPQIRLIFPIASSRFSIYATIGAGAGWANADESNKTDRGLGQDFTFILVLNGGLRYAITDDWSVWLGAMWHHLSNAQLSEPDKQNVGPDEVGFVMGAGYAF